MRPLHATQDSGMHTQRFDDSAGTGSVRSNNYKSNKKMARQTDTSRGGQGLL
jgi:hypothetical protein